MANKPFFSDSIKALEDYARNKHTESVVTHDLMDSFGITARVPSTVWGIGADTKVAKPSGPDVDNAVHTVKLPRVAFSGETFVLDTALAAELDRHAICLPVIRDTVRKEVTKALLSRQLSKRDILVTHVAYRDLGYAIRVCSDATLTRVKVEVAKIDSAQLGEQLFEAIDEDYFTAY